jgi:hypothetical protein
MAIPCVYNADIKVRELNCPGFLYPIKFKHNSKSFLIVRGKIFDYPSKKKDDAVKILEFIPSKYYRDNPPAQEAFYAAMQKAVVKPANRVNILDSVACLSRYIDGICSIFDGAIVRMFCVQHDLVSRLRFILLCAFGMLYNFVDQTKFKLLLRGGMALRMNLMYFNGGDFRRRPDIMRIMAQISQMIQESPQIDMDAVVIVDPSVSPDEMAAFKTVFIKVLLHSIRKVTAERRYDIVCASATGDANTTKVKIQRGGDEHSSELADISFKYADDPVIAGYGEYSQQMEFSWHTPLVPEISDLAFTWKYPGIDQLETEYAYVIDKLETQLKDLSDDPQKYLFTHDFSALLKRNKYDTDRFTSKRSMVRGVTAAREAQAAEAAAYAEAQAAEAAAYAEAQLSRPGRRQPSNRRRISRVPYDPSSGGKKRRGQRKRTVRRRRSLHMY